VFQSQPRPIYRERGHRPLHGPLTVLLVAWALALPAILLLLTGLGPIGWLLGVVLAIMLVMPWLAGLVIVWLLRSIT
jgi:hypothetical protein